MEEFKQGTFYVSTYANYIIEFTVDHVTTNTLKIRVHYANFTVDRNAVIRKDSAIGLHAEAVPKKLKEIYPWKVYKT